MSDIPCSALENQLVCCELTDSLRYIAHIQHLLVLQDSAFGNPVYTCLIFVTELYPGMFAEIHPTGIYLSTVVCCLLK